MTTDDPTGDSPEPSSAGAVPDKGRPREARTGAGAARDARNPGYRGALSPREDRLARPWLLAVLGIFVAILVLSVLGVPSRLLPDPTPVPTPIVSPSASASASGSPSESAPASASADPSAPASADPSESASAQPSASAGASP